MVKVGCYHCSDPVGKISNVWRAMLMGPDPSDLQPRYRDGGSSSNNLGNAKHCNFYRDFSVGVYFTISNFIYYKIYFYL